MALNGTSSWEMLHTYVLSCLVKIPCLMGIPCVEKVFPQKHYMQNTLWCHPYPCMKNTAVIEQYCLIYVCIWNEIYALA